MRSKGRAIPWNKQHWPLAFEQILQDWRTRWGVRSCSMMAKMKSAKGHPWAHSTAPQLNPTRNAEQKCVKEAPFPAHSPGGSCSCLCLVLQKSQACCACTCGLKNLSSQQTWSTLVLWTTPNFAQGSWPDMQIPADARGLEWTVRNYLLQQLSGWSVKVGTPRIDGAKMRTNIAAYCSHLGWTAGSFESIRLLCVTLCLWGTADVQNEEALQRQRNIVLARQPMTSHSTCSFSESSGRILFSLLLAWLLWISVFMVI